MKTTIIIASRFSVAINPYVFLTLHLTAAFLALSGSAIAEEPVGPSSDPRVSDDGRIVVFQTQAPNFVDGESGFKLRLVVQDLDTGETTLITERGLCPSISGNGLFVAFSYDDYASGDQIYVYDWITGVTSLVSASETGNG